MPPWQQPVCFSWLVSRQLAAPEQCVTSVHEDCSSIVHEPEVVFQTKKVQFFDSLSEMDNEDARCMAVSPPEQHLKNATELNRNIFQEKLSHPMDKKLRFRE